jgi:SrtB family sortase
MPRWSELLEETPDIVGWLKLDGCDIDYAIVQGEDNSFYLDHSLDGSYKYEGWLFLGVEGDVLENKKNLVIHGHNMANGRMFGNLSRYDVTRGENAALKFYKENPTFTFDTLYEENEYKILSVMMVDVDENPFFNYLYNTFASDTVFDRFLHLHQSALHVHHGVDVNSDDELVMLSNLHRALAAENGRLVVVGRKVREGEDPTVDTENVTINENVLMPKAWYQLYGGTEPTFDD